MYVLFLDDSNQRERSGGRQRYYAFSGVICPEETLKQLGTRVNEVKRAFGFPEDEEIKWSPDRRSWLYSKLKGSRRTRCWDMVLRAAEECGCQAIVSVVDRRARSYSKAQALQINIENLLERFQMFLQSQEASGIIIADQGGGHREEQKMVTDTLEYCFSGTRFIQLKDIVTHVIPTNSSTLVQLQVADLVAGITSAMVAGNTEYAEDLFPAVERILYRSQAGEVKGYGLKLSPADFKERYCILNEEQDKEKDFPW